MTGSIQKILLQITSKGQLNNKTERGSSYSHY